MSTAAATGLSGLSWEQFLELPDDPALRHAELIDGEVLVNPPTLTHQQVVLALAAELRAWTKAGTGRGLVTMDPAVQVSEQRGYLPDVAWFPADRCSLPGEELAVSGPPALAVEVLSPSTRVLDAQRKRGDYARVGVLELWLVDPMVPAALVLRREPSDADFSVAADLGATDRLESPRLPGLSLLVADLLAR